MGKITDWKSWEEYRNSEQWAVCLPKGGKLPWAMFYPADYSIGASNLGFQYIFRGLREAGIWAERFFASPIPYRSVDGDTLLERFPIISASISYEPDVEEFFKWLCGANISLDPIKRKENNSPLIIVGGAISYINPLLVSAVADCIILGDGMEVLPEVLKELSQYDIDKDRENLWRRLSKISSVFVPPVEIDCEQLITKKIIAKNQLLDTTYPMYSSWISDKAAFGDTLLLELQRGCIRNCSYCTLPACFGKARRREFSLFENCFDKLCERLDFSQVGLITPEAGDYREIDKMLDLIESKGKGVSFASLRIDRLNEKMLSALSRGGRHSITVAPETGNDKLRIACNKKFTNELIIEKLKLAASFEINKVKLYFMIGLPNETDADIISIARLCADIIAQTGQKLIISAGAFIPKPWTKWQREPFIGVSEIKRRYKLLSSEIKKIKKKTPQLRLTSAKEAETEFVLAWAGIAESRKLASDIEKYGKRKFNTSDREKTLLQLSQFV